MIRALCQNLLRLLAAVVLLALGICAVEVFLRARAVKSRWQPGPVAGFSSEQLIEPSRTTYWDTRPLLELPIQPVGQSASENTLAEPLLFRTNEWGLRGSPVSVPKPRGVYRILCLGGADLLAPEIPERETCTVHLESALRTSTAFGIEVLNGGCPRAGPLVNLLRCRKLLGLQPDLVILLLAPGDLALDHPVRSVLKLDEAGRVSHASHPLLKAQATSADALCEEFLVAQWLVENVSRQLLQVDGSTQAPAESDSLRDSSRQVFNRRLVEWPLAQTKQITEAIYAQTLLVLYPTPWDLQSRAVGDSEQTGPQALLHTLAADLQLLFVDLIPEFQAHPQRRSLYQPSSGSLSTEGHSFIAEQIQNHVLQQMTGGGPPAANSSREPTRLSQWP